MARIGGSDGPWTATRILRCGSFFSFRALVVRMGASIAYEPWSFHRNLETRDGESEWDGHPGDRTVPDASGLHGQQGNHEHPTENGRAPPCRSRRRGGAAHEQNGGDRRGSKGGADWS